MATKLPWVALAGVFSVTVLGMAACKSEGPDAPPRKNGCIDTGCAPVTTAAPPASTTDAGTGNGVTAQALDPFAGQSETGDEGLAAEDDGTPPDGRGLP